MTARAASVGTQPHNLLTVRRERYPDPTKVPTSLLVGVLTSMSIGQIMFQKPI